MNLNNSRRLTLAVAVTCGCDAFNAPACKQNVSSPESASTAAPATQNPVVPSGPGPASMPSASPTQAGGIAWTVPADGEPVPNIRCASRPTDIRAVAGDPEDAECAVYFFGTGQGGSVEANLERWAQQFTGPDGGAPKELPKRIKRMVAGLKVSTLTASGTYLGAGGMMGQPSAPKAQLSDAGGDC